ncbi:MAG: TIGR00725 family protein [Candidatus Omnitrophica bacterium]|nr:TIGR00725 family protein [Candidatus Omnitrophota bacterium]
MNVSVIGGSTCSKKDYRIAQELGRLIAHEGWILVCGGRTGIMEAACRGAKEAGGLTVGILPSIDGEDGNAYLDVKIPTGLGFARNILVVRASRIIVAISGKRGTLSEIAFAFNEERKVIGIHTWKIKGVIQVKTPQQAVARIKKYLKKISI